MIRRPRIGLAWAIAIGVAALLIAEPALACSVCVGGDPDAALNRGAKAGTLVLLGTIGGVLTALASLLIFWARRAAQLEGQVLRASRPLPAERELG